MEQFLFNFGVHQNLVRNISFQKSFVDVTLKPLLAEKLINKTERHNIFSLKFFPCPHAPFVVLLEAQVGQVFDDGDEDVFRVIFLELRRSLAGSYLVRCFFDLLVRVGITVLSCLVFMHLSDQLGFNKYLLFEPDSKFKLIYNKK